MSPHRFIITGASSGLGKALAMLALADGHEVVGVARRTAKLAYLSHSITGDINQESTWEAIKKSAEGSSLPLVLINNAGAAKFGFFAESDHSDWVSNIETNLTAAMACTQAVLPSMLAKGNGRILNVLSVAAKISLPGTAAYAASKAGLAAFSKVLREEVRAKGIRITDAFPGAINTPIWDPFESTPPRDEMITTESAAKIIYAALTVADDATIDEITFTPVKGIL